jgi:hypothetical protein
MQAASQFYSCPERDSNPHGPCGPEDLKACASVRQRPPPASRRINNPRESQKWSEDAFSVMPLFDESHRRSWPLTRAPNGLRCSVTQKETAGEGEQLRGRTQAWLNLFWLDQPIALTCSMLCAVRASPTGAQ